jgi:hypothetical protein
MGQRTEGKPAYKKSSKGDIINITNITNSAGRESAADIEDTKNTTDAGFIQTRITNKIRSYTRTINTIY